MVRKKIEALDEKAPVDSAEKNTAKKKKIGKVPEAYSSTVDYQVSEQKISAKAKSDKEISAEKNSVAKVAANEPSIEKIAVENSTIENSANENSANERVPNDDISGARMSSFRGHKELLASIVEYSSDAIVGLSPTGDVLSWNKGARDLFRIEDKEAIGQNISSLISTKEKLVPLSAGLSSDTIEHAFTRKDGQALDLSIKVYPIDGTHDDTVYGAAIIRDITVQKQAEKELLLMSQQLVETNKQLEEYAWVAAHDLKEPLRTMGTYAKLVHDEYLPKLDADGKQMLSIIYGSATSALARIDDTLRYSSLSKSTFNAESVNLNQVVKTVLMDLQKAITESGAVISTAKLPIVYGNRDMLAVLFQNLISNAIKFRRKVAPEIRIKSKVSTTMAVITVQDNGIGVDQTDHEIIFGMFKRLDNSYPGTGLGLSIAKRIIDLHKGKIWLSSEAGKGTTFYIQLPTS
ncbi:MAG: ATP-binding protein [Candidatus Melainabacteria bacterium]|nr:ATP-binding protein [Candidatus Melainabacteria bacterium]